MCYNCGCGMPDDDMGQGHAKVDIDGKSITDKTFGKLAEEWGISNSEAKELVYGMLTGQTHDHSKEHMMEHLYDQAAKSQGMDRKQAMDETLKLLKKELGKN